MRIIEKLNRLPKRLRNSIAYSFAAIGASSTVLSIVGKSLNDFTDNIWYSILCVVVVFIVLSILLYLFLGKVYQNSVSMKIGNTKVTIECGDIFEYKGMKVIGCDSHFDTRVDDIIVSRKSLHGQLVLEHGETSEIKTAVKTEAERLNLPLDTEGQYSFPLGTVVKYESSRDGQTYLMLAMTELNKNHESHISMGKYEHMLEKMWTEISRVYASNDIFIPLLGNGITRIDGTQKDQESLLKCMLCTLNSSGITLNSHVTIVLFGDARNISLYEYKDMFRKI